MTRIAVLDDWQDAARGDADWSALQTRAEVVFFLRAFADDDATALADFDIVLSRCGNGPPARPRSRSVFRNCECWA